MGELGYLIGPIRLSPFAHFERLVSYAVDRVDCADRRPGDRARIATGAGWRSGLTDSTRTSRSSSLRVHRNPAPHDFNVVNVQWQVYVF